MIDGPQQDQMAQHKVEAQLHAAEESVFTDWGLGTGQTPPTSSACLYKKAIAL